MGKPVNILHVNAFADGAEHERREIGLGAQVRVAHDDRLGSFLIQFVAAAGNDE